MEQSNVLDFNAAKAFWSELAPIDHDWKARGLCAQTFPDAFFPEKGGSTREAKRICQGCEVRGECLASALANNEKWGIWGGMSERERRKVIADERRRVNQTSQPAREQRDATIVALGTSGAPVRWVAEQAGVSARTVLRVRKRTQLDQAA